MRPALPTILAVLSLAGLLVSPLSAQLQLPGVPRVGGVLPGVTDALNDTAATTDRTIAREARRLLRLRDQTLDQLLRSHGEAIERDAAGDPARRGELLAIAPGADDMAVLRQAGFALIAIEFIEGLDVAVVRLSLPDGMTLSQAEQLARKLAPAVQLTADNLYLQASSETPVRSAAFAPLAMAAQPREAGGVMVGVIDGAPGKAIPVTAQKGFARGAPAASDHGSAVASLLLATGVRQVWVADVYGTDPAGGNALAIAKALGWLAASGCKVVTISLVGPNNPVIERAVAAARKRGVEVVAAVGNDGPAAPPAYPASYAGVLAITGVDRKGRALIEAGRALHLDYAAPGAEVRAADAKGRQRLWRGTSFAAPLAAARLSMAISRGGDWRAAIDRDARDLGRKGPDDTYGRGLVCEGCAAKK